MSTLALSTSGRRTQALCFGRHALEMTVAMVAGMLVYGAVLGGALAAAGTTVERARLGEPELFALGMAASMSAAMVAWMRRRGHGRRSAGEMSAAMILPAAALIACHRAGVVSADAVCPVACVAMLPAMLGAMAFRFGEYTRPPRRREPAG